MSDPDAAAIENGLAAWTRGDLDALEAVLDPRVTLTAVEPGPWDCDNRDEVMALLRQRESQRPPGKDRHARVTRRDDATFLVSGLGGGDGTATQVTVAEGRVIAMRQVTAEPRDDDANAAVAALRAGDLAALTRALDARAEIIGGRVPGYGGRTLLHLVADWPGYTPRGPEVVRLLVERGANPNVRDDDDHGESPLHWAASNDDVDVARALLDGGADIEMPDGSIGTPLDNAIGYGCWHVAELLAQRGARVEKLWHAAALGRLDRLEELLTPVPARNDISQAFWHACAASQRRAAQRLLDAGADINWTPEYADGTPFDAATDRPTRQQNVVDWLKGLGARSGRPPASASPDNDR